VRRTHAFEIRLARALASGTYYCFWPILYLLKSPVCSLNPNYLPSAYLFTYNCDPSRRPHIPDLHPSPLSLIKGYTPIIYYLTFVTPISDVCCNFEGLIYPFFRCSSTNFCTSSLSFLESGYTFTLLGLKSSFTSIAWSQTFLMSATNCYPLSRYRANCSEEVSFRVRKRTR